MAGPSFSRKSLLNGHKKNLLLEKGSPFLRGPPDQCLLPDGIVRSLAHIVKTALLSLMREKCMRTLVCELLLGPSWNTAGPALLKRHKRCLGGEPAGQELGTRLKELR